MSMNSHDVDVGHRGCCFVFFQRTIGCDPELAFLHPRRNVRMCFRVHIWIDSQGNPSLHVDRSGDIVNGADFGGRLDIEHENIRLERVTNFVR